MRPLSDKSVKTIATVVPEVINTASRRKRVPKETVMNAIEVFLKENDYSGETLELAKSRIQKELSSIFGAAKTYPKDKLGDELHFALRYMHLAPYPKCFVFTYEEKGEIKRQEVSMNTGLTAEEIQKSLPRKVTKERFEKIMQGAPFFYTVTWFKHFYSETHRFTQLEKIYANKKGSPRG